MKIVKVSENKFMCTVILNGDEVIGYGTTETEAKVNCADHVHNIKLQLLRQIEELNEKLDEIQSVQRNELRVSVYDRAVVSGEFTGTPKEWNGYILRKEEPTNNEFKEALKKANKSCRY